MSQLTQSTNWKEFFIDIDIYHGIVRKKDWQQILEKKKNDVLYILKFRLFNEKIVAELNERPSFSSDGTGITLDGWAKQNDINLS